MQYSSTGGSPQCQDTNFEGFQPKSSLLETIGNKILDRHQIFSSFLSILETPEKDRETLIPLLTEHLKTKKGRLPGAYLTTVFFSFC